MSNKLKKINQSVRFGAIIKQYALDNDDTGETVERIAISHALYPDDDFNLTAKEFKIKTLRTTVSFEFEDGSIGVYHFNRYRKEVANHD